MPDLAMTNTTSAGDMVASFDRLDLEIPAEGNSAGAGSTDPLAADFNNDGKPDIVTVNWNVDDTTSISRSPTRSCPTSPS